MKSLRKPETLAGWLVFLIAFVVYAMTAERTGSLWDCGEFITGAYKLEVVHPPGAPLFMIVGRMFTFVAEMISNDPADIAFAVNLMSGMVSAFAAMFICWSTITLGRLAMNGRDGETTEAESYALAGAGLVAGLASAFCISIWFSAVEGEVYAMSTMFTAMTLWAVVKWYGLPDAPDNDRWLVLGVFTAGLSAGVHLLSLLVFPALALFYYFKKYQNPTIIGMGIASILGLVFIVFIQNFIIAGIPTLWAYMDRLAVNSFGMPFHSGLLFVLLIVGGLVYAGLRYAHKTGNGLAQKLIVAASLVTIGFSIFGVIVIRADANTPINMNNPDDAMRLLPYLNREQYGERALLKGPDFTAQPARVNEEERYGRVGDRYEIVDKKISYEYAASDQSLFPRMSDGSQGRPNLYRQWIDKPQGKPTFADNMKFMFAYQFNWMYFRYFMWNFVGKQNAEQGYYSWDKSSGHWMSGVKFIDEARLHNMDALPTAMQRHQGTNKYYFLPLLFGLLGMFFHAKKRGNDFVALLALFIITGLGIIVYSNQPPNEPRERDYVLVGSFFTFSMWIGMAVLALFEMYRERVQNNLPVGALAASAIVLVAPFLMGFQNFDDMSRRHHTGARDYANNFLQSCDKNAIIFTYGDNDTYPLWYAQEVENIRRDVRVVNLSLIAVDWYINQLNRKVNDSPPIKLSLTPDAIRGYKRNQVFVDPYKNGPRMNLKDAMKFVNEDHPVPVSSGRNLESYLPTAKFSIPVNRALVQQNKVVSDMQNVVNSIDFDINKSYVLKGDLAVMDIIANNAWERPIYFAVTVRQESLVGLDEYLQMEGLGLKLVPVKAGKDPLVPGVLGKGRVDADKVYDNVMNKFMWGNFDKMELFVDKSYAPSVQSHRYVILRAVQEFLRRGENAKAIELCDKYFEAFPNMNFPYDYNAFYFIQSYLRAGAVEKAKQHALILAQESAEHLNFYASLDPDDLAAGFASDQRLANNAKGSLDQLAKEIGDQAFTDQINQIFANMGQPVLN
ncbi:MAG: DUF2723 domain-containing protein [Bacteroidota bacterium]